MKKKILTFVGVFLLFSAAGAFSWGIGGAFGLPLVEGDLPGTNAMLSLKLDQFPFLLGAGIYIGDNVNIGVTADWHMKRENLFEFVNWYAGPGIYAALQNDTLYIGGRVPIALYVFPIDILELFVEIAPTLSASINPIHFPLFGLQSAFGFRFWF